MNTEQERQRAERILDLCDSIDEMKQRLRWAKDPTKTVTIVFNFGEAAPKALDLNPELRAWLVGQVQERLDSLKNQLHQETHDGHRDGRLVPRYNN